MLVPNQMVRVPYNHKTKAHYIARGYTLQNDHLYHVALSDVTPSSKVNVHVLCDYCGTRSFLRQLKNHHSIRKRQPDAKDACENCRTIKERDRAAASKKVTEALIVWTPEQIDTTFAEMTNFSPDQVRRKHSGWLSAVTRQYGSYRAYVTARGLDYEALLQTKRWDKSRIDDAFAAYQDQYDDLSPTALAQHNLPLKAAIVRHYGSIAAYYLERHQL